MFVRRRRRSLQKSLILATTIMMLCSIVVRAQSTTSLSGTVTDPQGKVLSGATVTLTNTANGVSRDAKTSDDGTYGFSQLAPGPYRIRVEAKGFKVNVQEDVQLLVATPKSINTQLEVGNVN